MEISLATKKIFCLSKDKMQRDENLKVVSIYDVPRYDYITALSISKKLDCDISVLCGDIPETDLMLAVIDIDDVAENRKLNFTVKELLQSENLDGHMSEFSKSGTGLHIFVPISKLDMIPSFRTRKFSWTKSFEYYSKERQVVIGGFNFNNLLPVSHKDTLKFIHKMEGLCRPTKVSNIIKVFNGKVISKTMDDMAHLLKIDSKFNKLWYASADSVDQSSHDLALMTKLCYYCDRNFDNALTLFMNSPYVLTKDSKHIKKLLRKDYIDGILKKM